MRGLIEASRTIYNREQQTHVKDSFNESTHLWRLRDNRLIEFEGIEYEKDVVKFQGRPHDFLGFDELPEFSERQFRFVNAWNRTTDPNQRCRVVATGNPPTTPEGRWVVKYWAPWLDSDHPNPAEPGELRWFAVIKGKDIECPNSDPIVVEGETINPRSRTFIPSRVTDNPYLMRTGYVSVLQSLPEPLRSQMLYGDFSIGTTDDAWQTIPTAWVRTAQERWKKTVKPDQPMTAMGVDVSRGGKDDTALAPRFGLWFDNLKMFGGIDTDDGPKVATLVIKNHEGDATVLIDVIGPGASAYDVLKDYRWFKTIPINNAEHKIIEKLRDKSGKFGFRNFRAASYWKLREMLDPNSGVPICLPPDNDLLADLCAPRYKLTVGGILLEPKEDVAQRIGRSPDKGDSTVMAAWGIPFKYKERPFRVIFGKQEDKGIPLRIVCSTYEDLHLAEVEVPSLLIDLRDFGEQQPIPSTNLRRNIDSLQLSFATIEPSELQSVWDVLLQPYGELPAKVMMDTAHGKRIWSFLLKKREERPQVICITSEDINKSLSVAYAITDVFRYPRVAITEIGAAEDEKHDGKPKHQHIYDCTKRGRAGVI